MLPEIISGVGAALLVYALYRGVNLIPLLFFGGAAYALLYMVRGGRFGTRLSPVSAVPVHQGSGFSFNDIGGQGAAKQELCEALDFIKDADRVAGLGIRPLKGILLAGPPGTGKTLLAKAAAQYTGSAFFAASGSEFVEVYAGVGAQRVRQLFDRARTEAGKSGLSSAVIFIDELEILGGARGRQLSHLEYDQTLNQLLVEMDGISTGDQVKILLIGATNRADILDRALLRPGRFDRVVMVELPDREARLEILRIHIRSRPIDPETDLEGIARETYGFSGAHLESVCNEAAILAYRQGHDRILQAHLDEAIEKVAMGEKVDRRPIRDELKRVAIHELGHAVIAEEVREGSVSSITVSGRGTALGYTRQIPADDLYLRTPDLIEEQILLLLGGAAAEELVLGSRSTGSRGDFTEAARQARELVLTGMSGLGIVDEEILSDPMLHSEVRGILQRLEKEASRILSEKKDLLTRGAEILLEREKLSGEEFRELLLEATV
ncbi:MAG: AAA family ATPase [Firmicutes bacterium]|nr:AAA family ATPase [Bacillota bacterium]